MPAYHYPNGRIGTTLETLVRADRPLVVTSIVVCNTDTSNRNFDLRHVPADEAATDDHSLFHLLVVRSNNSQTIELDLYLQTGDSLQAYGSAADVLAVHVYALDYETWLARRTG